MKRFPTLLPALALMLLAAGCSEETGGGIRSSSSTAEAGDHLQDAYSDADPQLRESADQISRAMIRGEYRKALGGIEKLKNSRPSFQQGVAINDSLIQLEAELLRAKNSDPEARRAYEILTRINRN